jgi:signal peptidase I
MVRLANLGLGLILSGLMAVAFAVAIVPAASGTKTVTIDRSSMQRVLPQGSLAYVAPQSSYGIGDVITFSRNGQTITHQITALLPNPANNVIDGSVLQTKGTENAEPDPFTVSRDQVLGRVIYSLPVAGVAMKVIATPVVMAFLALLVCGLYLFTTSAKGNRTMDDTIRAESLPQPEAKADMPEPDKDDDKGQSDDVEVGAVPEAVATT